jgi:hypothetical protein
MLNQKASEAAMAVIREFHRSWRGPAPSRNGG